MKKQVIQLGSWSWFGGNEQPAFAVVVNDRVWGSYCYKEFAQAVADRITHRVDVSGYPTLEEYSAWSS